MNSTRLKQWNVFQSTHFLDYLRVRVVGGDGGDGCISFLSTYGKEFAGPDGADGGNGGHVVFKVGEVYCLIGNTWSSWFMRPDFCTALLLYIPHWFLLLGFYFTIFIYFNPLYIYNFYRCSSYIFLYCLASVHSSLMSFTVTALFHYIYFNPLYITFTGTVLIYVLDYDFSVSIGEWHTVFYLTCSDLCWKLVYVRTELHCNLPPVCVFNSFFNFISKKKILWGSREWKSHCSFPLRLWWD